MLVHVGIDITVIVRMTVV